MDDTGPAWQGFRTWVGWVTGASSDRPSSPRLLPFPFLGMASMVELVKPAYY
jgi:hypothetical protein